MRITLISRSPAETRELGAALAAKACPGDVIVLSGELGSGKTVLAQGVGAGLGVDQPIVSPTFVLVHTLQGRLTLHHADLWRLDDPAEIADLGLGELAEEGSVLLVEWGEKGLAVLGPERLELEFQVIDEQTRLIEVEAVGRGWGRRWEELVARLEPWWEAAP